MIVSIYYSIAACMLCLMLSISLIIRKLTKGRTNTYFLSLVFVIFATTVFDVLGLLYGNFIPASSDNVHEQEIINFLYFLTHNFVPPFFLLYVSAIFGFWFWFKESKKMAWMFWAPYGISLSLLIVNMWTPVIFGIDKNGNYYRGNLIYVLFVISAIYILETIICIIKMRKNVKKSTAVVLGVALPVSAFFATIQMFYPAFRLEMLSMSIMLFIVALNIHRPEENLDQVVFAQSYNAFLKDLSLSQNSRRPYAMLVIKIRNHTSLKSNLGSEQYLMVLRSISVRIERIFKVMGCSPDIYNLDNTSFAVVEGLYKEELLIDAGRLIASYLQEPLKLKSLEVSLDARVVSLKIPKHIMDKNTIIDFVHNFPNFMPEKRQLMCLGDYVEQKDFRIKAGVDSIIARAISEQNFKMYYQPIYSVKDEKFVSAEALIRLIDPEEGFISPSVFIPASEESGAIHEIGNFVFEDVIRFIGENDFDKLGLKYIEINLSVAQCIEPGLVDKVNSFMEDAGVTADKINLEITETAVDYDPKISKRNIEALSKAGFKFSLDDYGTGYSNIARVAKLPIDIVKIDKSIVDEMDNPKMMIIIENTVAMLKKIKKKILVEGIEDERALNRFVELGCDYIQGYYYSKPLPEEDFLEFIRKANG